MLAPAAEGALAAGRLGSMSIVVDERGLRARPLAEADEAILELLKAAVAIEGVGGVGGAAVRLYPNGRNPTQRPLGWRAERACACWGVVCAVRGSGRPHRPDVFRSGSTPSFFGRSLGLAKASSPS